MTNIIDSLRDFALPDRRLFPCDTPTLTNASAAAFDAEGKKLPTTEKIAAARHIAKRASEQGVPVHDRLVARVAGTEISPMFKVALFTRKDVTAWHPTAVSELKVIAKLGELIVRQDSAESRTQLLDKLASTIEEFDRKWDKDGVWREAGIPDAVDTVFAKSAEEQGVVRVGSREIRAHDFARFDKTAAAKVLAPGAMKVAESWTAFMTANWADQTSIAAFIPER